MTGVKTSARNQFRGKVIKVTNGAVNSEIVVDLNGQPITAIITNESAKALGLQEGSPVYVLFKASWVILAVDGNLKVSARNCLPGTVKKVEKGAVNTEVDVTLDGGQELAAIITNKSTDALDLKEGAKVQALIKASHVILAVEA